MSQHPARTRPLPLVLRLAGLWLIWCAWASACGWILSACGWLRPAGYALASPLLLAAALAWWKSCGSTAPLKIRICRRGHLRWLVPAFQLTALLTLIGALLHTPWSFDAVTYRLPRILYWLANHGWYWVGTIDGRLDYSGTGLEWQSIPLLLATGSDRWLFLLSFLPYLMAPGLTFLACRTIGVSRRHALLLMWLLPAAYCIGLQAGGLQNDGYSVAFCLAALAFAGRAISCENRIYFGFSLLAASLLTGAKVSNLPLMLPLGILIAFAAYRCKMLKWKWLPVLPATALVSFLPLAILAWSHTGDWTGDPHDQWGFRTKNPVAAVGANLILWANDALQPPVLVGASVFQRASQTINTTAAPLWKWFSQSHRMFHGVEFGDLVYEGGAGPGFGIGLFLIVSFMGGIAVCKAMPSHRLPLLSRLILGGTLLAWTVYLSKLGTDHSPRNAAPYYPLLLIAFCRLAPVRRFLNGRWAFHAVLVSALSILPVIVLTPARPLVPLRLLDGLAQAGPLAKPVAPIAHKYRVWEAMRDDMKSMRDHLPADVRVIGYAGGFRDTAYGLWKPLGIRTIEEIGITNVRTSARPAVPEYVVGTRRGVESRFAVPFEKWCADHRAVTVHSESRSLNLDADTAENRETWYLLKTHSTSEP